MNFVWIFCLNRSSFPYMYSLGLRFKHPRLLWAELRLVTYTCTTCFNVVYDKQHSYDHICDGWQWHGRHSQVYISLSAKKSLRKALGA